MHLQVVFAAVGSAVPLVRPSSDGRHGAPPLRRREREREREGEGEGERGGREGGRERGRRGGIVVRVGDARAHANVCWRV